MAASDRISLSNVRSDTARLRRCSLSRAPSVDSTDRPSCRHTPCASDKTSPRSHQSGGSYPPLALEGRIDTDPERLGPRVVPLSPAAARVLAGLPHAADNPWVIAGRKPGTRLSYIAYHWYRVRDRARSAARRRTRCSTRRKRRGSMVDPDRNPLSGLVEIDETSLPFRTKNDPAGGGPGRSHDGKLLVVGGIEVGVGNRSLSRRSRSARLGPEVARTRYFAFEARPRLLWSTFFESVSVMPSRYGWGGVRSLKRPYGVEFPIRASNIMQLSTRTSVSTRFARCVTNSKRIRWNIESGDDGKNSVALDFGP